MGGNALQIQEPKKSFMLLILLTFYTCSFPLTLTSSNDSSFAAILDVLMLVFSELDDTDDDRDDDSDDDFVCRAGGAVCDAEEFDEIADVLCDDDTDENNDDRALGALPLVCKCLEFRTEKQKEI